MIQFLADLLIVPLTLVAAYALVRWTPRPKLEYYKYGLMAGLTSLLVAKLLSILYQPAAERPFELAGQTPGALYLDNPGFPSDHMLFVTVLTLAVFALTGRRKLAIVLGCAAVLIGVGRVLAQVHTPLDVVGGIIAGLVGGIWYYKMLKS